MGKPFRPPFAALSAFPYGARHKCDRKTSFVIAEAAGKPAQRGGFDHVQPISGGRHALDNLVVSCSRCNLLKDQLTAAGPAQGRRTALCWGSAGFRERAEVKNKSPGGRVVLRGSWQQASLISA